MRNGTDLSPAEALAWYGLLRTHAALVRDVDRTLRAAHGLALPEYEVLREVVEAPQRRIRMGELAAHVMLTPAGLTGVIDRLVRAGFVERVRSGHDARCTYAIATPGGERHLRDAADTHRDVVRRAYTGRLDDAELDLVGRLWERVAVHGRPTG